MSGLNEMDDNNSAELEDEEDDDDYSPASAELEEEEDDEEEEEIKDEEEIEDEEEEEEAQEKALKEEIRLLQETLFNNPFDYDSHVRLIAIARKAGDLELVRKAREGMASSYPLTPNLWLEWISDEQRLLASDEDRLAVVDLFERALRDYVSIDLWLKYIYYVIGLPDEHGDVKKVRELCERAINSVGLHVTKGTSIWIAYRTFESGIIEMVGPQERVNQHMRIYELFKRQLAVPLVGMEETLKEFHTWHEKIKAECPELEVDPSSVKYSYDKAYSLLQKLTVYEEDLASSDPPHYNEYLKYIGFEEVNGTPPRVQCIYERAVLENCLVPEIWINYTRYFDKKVQDLSMVIPIHERAVRNCTWSVSVWVNYLRSMERNNADHDAVIKVFERSLSAGFQSGKEYQDLWLTYLDYLKRRTKWDDEKQLEQLRKNFQAGIEHLANFPDGDIECSLPIYMAKIEAKFIKDMGEARRIWHEVIQSRRDLSHKAETWIEYANFERCYGDEAHFRKVLLKGLNSNVDWPETIGNLLIKYEREEGTSLADLDEVLDHYQRALSKATKRREELAKKTDKMVKAKPKKGDKDTRKRAAKNETSNDNKACKTDSDVFKVPAPPSSKLSDSDGPSSKKLRLSPNAVKDEKILAEMKRQTELKTKGDEDRKLNTIFVSNLDFSVEEDRLREEFSKFGEIVDLRLVRNYKGLSKGYCYIEYASVEGAREAIKNDRMIIEARPAFISEMGKRPGLKYSTSKEKNKLFVSNLSPSVNRQKLSEIFEKHGPLKDVRLVTYRNGHSKGCAYVEFKNEKGAAEGLKADGLLVEDKTIKVAISDPSNKGGRRANEVLGSALIHPSTSGNSARLRISAPLIPRAVRQIIGPTQSSNPNGRNIEEMDTSSPSSSRDSM